MRIQVSINEGPIYDVVIVNKGPDESQNQSRTRDVCRYEWTFGGLVGSVLHDRNDGAAELCAIVFDDMTGYVEVPSPWLVHIPPIDIFDNMREEVT